jgi:hypothetical protein
MKKFRAGTYSLLFKAKRISLKRRRAAFQKRGAFKSNKKVEYGVIKTA